MRLKDITEAKKQEPIKARDPNWRDMEALRKSGAAGSHGDKTKTIPRKEKYKKISMEDQFEAYMDEAKEPGEYRTIGGVRYYIVKNKSGKAKGFSGPTPAAKKYAQTGGNWYDEDVNEADPDTLGKMNPKMRDLLSKVDQDDQTQAKADAEAKAKAKADQRAEAARLRKENPEMLQQYIDMLKSHDWTYDYSDDHRAWTKGHEERNAIRSMAQKIDPDLEIYNKYDPLKKEDLGEKLDKDDDMGDYIKDFYKSDAPQFKGKSKAKRRQMAIAAKLSTEGSDIFKALQQIDEVATAGATSAGNIATVVSPHIAHNKKKPKKQKPTDNALDMKGTSIFGGPLKR